MPALKPSDLILWQQLGLAAAVFNFVFVNSNQIQARLLEAEMRK